jgi:hypothetical protein
MDEDKKTPIFINDVEYIIENMTKEQQLMVNHISDLDRKIASSQFSLDQLNVGKHAFIRMLTESLATKVEEQQAE